jgi:uncharacterized protein (TIGR03435 family)
MRRVVIMLFGLGVAFAQEKPRFEVASVKLHQPTPGPFRSTKEVGPAGVTFTNVDLNSSIRSAYGVAGYQIVGGPGWLTQTGLTQNRYDIVAKAAGAVPKEQLMLMLQTLLEDRFRLRVHREMKERPVFGLVVGKKGLKVHAGKEDGETEIGGTAHLIDSRGISMKGLASALTQFTLRSDRPVLDMTGLPGVFDITLDFVTDDLAARDNPGADIFAALQEIGLQLEPRNSLIEVLSIDSAENVSGN